MKENRIENYKYTLYLLITVLGWGIMYPASKHAVSSGIDGYYLTFIRYVLGALLVSTVLLLIEGKKSYQTEGKTFQLWFFGTIGFAGLNFLTFIGIGFSSAEHATIILALMPMLSIILSSILTRNIPNIKTILCTVLAFVGIVLVITNGDFNNLIASSNFVGDLLLLAATTCWVIYTYFANTIIAKYKWSALRVTALSSSLGVISIIAITLTASFLGFASPPSLDALTSSGFDIFVLVTTTLVIITWNAGINGLGAINGILFVNLVPVISFIIGIYQGHTISYTEIIGAIITIIALILNNIFMRSIKNKK
ncbi:EamA-like transporter family protein [Gilliamella bombicola]|uniref:EamA-like transporter family protein n=2 Tax=Gilliamella TaxID=1193503 RepID=A0A1C3ZXY0_9GAMM|nr:MULTISPECIES: DMT family transporter [Gilliamella]NUF27081.1 EamA family transporter [Gilliamella sp. ESL0254]SCB87080.1 EamA-like transporter family protein [Gilliamella bombicola]